MSNLNDFSTLFGKAAAALDDASKFYWAKFKAHDALNKTQRATSKSLVLSVTRDSVVVAFDFSGFATAIKEKRSMADAHDDKQAMMVTVYRRQDDGSIGSSHFMFISHATNDSRFFRRAIWQVVDILVNDGVVSCKFFSDGGPKHFKTKESLVFALITLRRKYTAIKSISWHFFAPHHGKWVYNGMAAVVKRRVFVLARRAHTEVRSPEQVAEAASSLSNMTAIHFEELDARVRTVVHGLDKVRSHFKFEATRLDYKAATRHADEVLPEVAAWTSSAPDAERSTYVVRVSGNEPEPFKELERSKRYANKGARGIDAATGREAAAASAAPATKKSGVDRLVDKFPAGSLIEVGHQPDKSSEAVVGGAKKTRLEWWVAKVVAVKRIEPISSSGSTANHGIALTYAWKGDNDVFTGKLTSTILSKEDEKRFRKHKEK